MRKAGGAPVAWLVTLALAIFGLLGVASWAGYRLWTEMAQKPPAPKAPSAQPTVAAGESRREAQPVLEPPPPATRAARLTPPRLTPQDTARTAEEAYADLWSALRRGDGATASKYVPAAKRETLEDEQAVVADFMGISPVEQLVVSKATTNGDKAVLFAKASSSTMTDSAGKPSPIDVVVRMAREDGGWRVLSQMWLISTPPEKWQSEAMAWLAAPPASGPQARLEALGLRLDADSFQAAVARGEVEQVRLFLEAGLSAKTRMEDGMSLLSLALLGMPQKTESEEIVIALVRAGADVEERTPTGLTPLMRAAFSCKPRVVAALIEAGAKLDARSGTGDTALGEAGNCPEAAALLRKAGAR